MASEIGKKLRTERLRRKLTQAKFAELLEISLSTYTKMEQMARTPKNPKFILLALKWLKHEREVWLK